jgi:hypothetical protein
MIVASIQVSGPSAEPVAEALHGRLQAEVGDAVGRPQHLKGDEIITIISLALGAFSPAKAMWDWWRAREPDGTRVKILLPDGSELDLAVSNLEELQLKLDNPDTTN